MPRVCVREAEKIGGAHGEAGGGTQYETAPSAAAAAKSSSRAGRWRGAFGETERSVRCTLDQHAAAPSAPSAPSAHLRHESLPDHHESGLVVQRSRHRQPPPHGQLHRTISPSLRPPDCRLSQKHTQRVKTESQKTGDRRWAECSAVFRGELVSRKGAKPHRKQCPAGPPPENPAKEMNAGRAV